MPRKVLCPECRKQLIVRTQKANVLCAICEADERLMAKQKSAFGAPRLQRNTSLRPVDHLVPVTSLEAMLATR